MIINIAFIAALAGCAIVVNAHPNILDRLHSHSKRKTSPQNICGAATGGFICDPTSPNGGPCCSHAGYCGSTKDYCGTGCQPAFGKCDPPAGDVSGDDNEEQGSKKHETSKRPLPQKKDPPTVPGDDDNTSNPAHPPGASPPATKSGACYTLPDNPAARFRHHALYTFTTTTLPPGLRISNNAPIRDSEAPYSHKMSSSNVAFNPPYVHLTVLGSQQTSPITGAELATALTDIKHASVRTTAIFSPVPGVCHGLFFYASDTQETDIEYLTSPASTSNPPNTPQKDLPLHFTNQPVDGVRENHSYAQSKPPSDKITSEDHEYRIDWTEGENVFFVDGKERKRFGGPNVPTQKGTWLWNNWANGGKGWSVGPPEQDSVLKIRRIEMWYNREGEEEC